MRPRAEAPYDTPVQGSHPRHRRAITTLLIASIALVLWACEGQPKAGNLSAAISRYEEGRYSAALIESEALLQSDAQLAKSQGALIGGMSAFKLGKVDQAERLALQAQSSSDPSIGGSALVLLGDIRLSQHRPEDAACCFSQASTKLTGNDATRAREFADRTLVLTARPATPPMTRSDSSQNEASSTEIAAAPAWTLTHATPAAPQAAVLPPADPAPTVKPTRSSNGVRGAISQRQFTIRAGSYSTQIAAQKRAKDLTKDLLRAKAPAARVDAIQTTKGEDLFAVRIGWWPTRAEAEKVLTVLARRDLMVGAIDPD